MDALEAKECLKEIREEVLSGAYHQYDYCIEDYSKMIEPDGKLNAFYVLCAYSDGCFDLRYDRKEGQKIVVGISADYYNHLDNLTAHDALLESLGVAGEFSEENDDFSAISESVADLVNYVEADEKLTVPGVNFLGEPVTGLFFFNAWRNDILNLDLREKNNYKVKVDKRLKKQIPDINEKVREFFRVLREYNDVDEDFIVSIV